MIEDVRFALRQLWKNPGFAAAAVITLGLGIGAASAMFGLIQGVLLSPPPYTDPARLVLVTPARVDGRPYTDATSIGQWIRWRSEGRTLQSIAMYRWTFNFLVLPDGSESLGGMVVTQDFFKTLGLHPIAGREFMPAEAGRPKVPPTAIILGYELWERRFHRDPGIVGQTVRISRFPAPLPVVGIMPPGVRFLPDPANASEPNYDVNAHVDFWFLAAPDETQPSARGWNTVARLRDGTTPQQAHVELAALSARQAEADPNLRGLTVTAEPLISELNQAAGRLLLPLFASVALVFVVACVNVAGLCVARGLQRHREYAMRAALGASRTRLFRQLLTESTALSMLSAIAGAAFAVAAVAIFKAVGGHAVPRTDAVTVGWPVFTFGCGAALIAAILSGVLPALRAASSRHFQGLKGSRSTAGKAERRLLSAIATVQIVLTVALLAGAALLIRTMNNLINVRPGYETENILAVTVTNVTPNTFKEFHTQALERVTAIPGVTHAAFVWGLPLTGNKWSGNVQLVDQAGSERAADQLSFPLRSITPDYFQLMGMDIVEGRAFQLSDTGDAPRVMIVNQTLARKYFPGTSAVGKKMLMGGGPKRDISIVGVVSDTRTEALSERAEPEVYLPFWQSGAFSKHLVLRATADPRALAPLVRREIRAVDPTAAVERFTTMAQIRRESVASRTFAMRLLVGFSVVATMLSLVGIYGVLSLSVGSRQKEIAVRKAIGAQRYDILRMILAEGGRLVAIGVVAGSIVAVFFGRALETYLFDVRAADPRSLGAAALLFAAFALGACLLPAVRAARTEVLSALHQD
jgi:putative ABC transport system permease protein